MEDYKCIIIEDEPIAAEILADYIADVPFLSLIKHYENAVSALADLNNHQIDVIFLDISLPKLTGLHFIQTLKNPPQIIITTAFNEYALNGYDLNVVDYLLKPIEFNRFLKAVNKLRPIGPEMVSKSLQKPEGKDFLFVNFQKRRVKIFFRDILYIESRKEYVTIVTKEKSITIKAQLGKIAECLVKTDFLRIHRSFIIAKDKIEGYSSTEIELYNKKLPIGRSYKELVINILDEL